MMFNKLTPAELERLAYLSEECGETIQAIGKILRHGYESINPDRRHLGTNRVQLEKEIANVLTAINTMINANDLHEDTIKEYTKAKHTKYMHHQEVEKHE